VTRLLHLALDERSDRVWIVPFIEALREVGELEVVENARDRSVEEIAGLIRGCDVLLIGWGAIPIPREIAGDPGRLRYVCSVTGSVRTPGFR
jgi:hypothetical protein